MSVRILLTFLCFAAVALADESDPAARARAAFRGGRFDEASALYRKALSRPDADQATLLHNLGVCAFRQNRPAEALAWFSRSRLRRPRDPDTAFNIRFLEGQLGVDPPRGDSLTAQLLALRDSLTTTELLWLVVVLESAALVGWVILRGRRRLRPWLVMVGVLALLVAAGLIHRSFFEPPAAVVVAPRAQLRVRADASASRTLELTAGESVRIEESSLPWLRVSHTRGQGWIAADEVVVID